MNESTFYRKKKYSLIPEKSFSDRKEYKRIELKTERGESSSPFLTSPASDTGEGDLRRSRREIGGATKNEEHVCNDWDQLIDRDLLGLVVIVFASPRRAAAIWASCLVLDGLLSCRCQAIRNNLAGQKLRWSSASKIQRLDPFPSANHRRPSRYVNPAVPSNCNPRLAMLCEELTMILLLTLCILIHRNCI
jgi:hypothetical protein